MNRKWFFIALFAGLFVSRAMAQMEVDVDSSVRQNGLTVASEQKVVAKPTKFRLFATLAERDTYVKAAIAKLAELKKAAIEKLLAIGAKKDDIDIAETQIYEWKEMNGGGSLERAIRIPLEMSDDFEYTAYAAVQVDWEIKDLRGDELLVKFADLRDQIRKNGVFRNDGNEKKKWHRIAKPSDFFLVVVGEISEDAVNAACKRAYEEANARARSNAAIADRPLGKLEAMTFRKYGRFLWQGYADETGYSVPDRSVGLPNPMLAFRLSPTEVYGSRASELYRIYTIELWFELK
jgi:hypothetical protein